MYTPGKLRAILLTEADFDFLNKIVYGVHMLDNARKHEYSPEEIHREKKKMADNGTLAKVLFYDFSEKTRLTSGQISLGAANCYDRLQCCSCYIVTSVPLFWSARRSCETNLSYN